VWRRDACKDTGDSLIEQGVDDIIGWALLIEYVRRLGCDLPTLSETRGVQTCPTVGSVAAAVAECARNPFLAVVFEPNDFAAIPFPVSILDERWERRLADATWLVFHDRELPLSLFGDFHQLCAGAPLTGKAAGLPARRARGMFYTPAPIVDYLVWTSLTQLFAERTPDDLSKLRVLDPSCGCGAFLIGCFRFLVLWHEQRFADAKLAQQRSIQLMERVFRGCDIDSRALKWTARLLSLAAWHGTKGKADFSNAALNAAVPDFRAALTCRSFLEPAGECGSLVPEPMYDALSRPSTCCC
jgi:hypothetical protein